MDRVAVDSLVYHLRKIARAARELVAVYGLEVVVVVPVLNVLRALPLRYLRKVG